LRRRHARRVRDASRHRSDRAARRGPAAPGRCLSHRRSDRPSTARRRRRRPRPGVRPGRAAPHRPTARRRQSARSTGRRCRRCRWPPRVSAGSSPALPWPPPPATRSREDALSKPIGPFGRSWKYVPPSPAG
jgi:hypothetical protein